MHTEEKLSLETIDSNYKKYDSLITFNSLNKISDTLRTLTSFVLIPLGNKRIIDALPVREIISMGRVSASRTIEMSSRTVQFQKPILPRIYNTQANDLIVPMPKQ